MNFIFVSTTCSGEKYKKVFESRINKTIDPMQKFLLQIMQGIAKDSNNKVYSISILPVSKSCYTPKKVEADYDDENGISFLYPSFLNGSLTRPVSVFFSVYKSLKKSIKKYNRNETILVTDPLNPYISIAARMVARFNGIKTMAIVTDLPMLATNMKQNKESFHRRFLRNMVERLSDYEAKRYNSYIFLTETMNEVVNHKGLPYIVIEGTAIGFNNSHTRKIEASNRVFVYAGGVYEKYGVKRLVDAFCKANIKNVELHIYGSGNLVDYIKEASKKYTNVKYCGCVLNSELQQIEKDADLLINPRFSDEEYTKYSFPSKILEYLSSGTAVLSTRLAGIPMEYDPYMFWIEDEREESMIQTLVDLSTTPKEVLISKGKAGQDYVLTCKNNVVQGNRISDFAKHILGQNDNKKRQLDEKNRLKRVIEWKK